MNRKIPPPAESCGFHLCSMASTCLFLPCLSPRSPGQVPLLAVPLAGSDNLTFFWLMSGCSQFPPLPHPDGLIPLWGQPHFHLLESPSWKLSSKPRNSWSAKISWLFTGILSSLLISYFSGRVVSYSSLCPTPILGLAILDVLQYYF